jgi:hypothetical protein
VAKEAISVAPVFILTPPGVALAKLLSFSPTFRSMSLSTHGQLGENQRCGPAALGNDAALLGAVPLLSEEF